MTRRKMEFIRTMRESEKTKGPIRMSKPSLAAFLHKSYQVAGADTSLKGQSPHVSKEELIRRLDYYAGVDEMMLDAAGRSRALQEEEEEENDDPAYKGGQYNNQWNENYNGYNGNNANAQQKDAWYSKFFKWFKSQYGNETSIYGDAEYNNTVQDMYGESDNRTYELDGLAEMSMKYAGCSSTTSYTSEVDGDDDQSSHFIAENLVQYRLCPADSCEDGSWNGCKSEYGEYMMKLEDFLDIQSDLRNLEVEMLCNYCEVCTQYNENDSFCNGGKCCAHTDECEENRGVCEGEEDEEEQMPDYDQLFDCMEVDISGYLDDDEYGYGDYGNGYSAYVGVHCNGLHMQVGLFSDATCTSLIGTDENIDIQNITGYDFSTEDLEEFFVPEGCLECGGEDYNVSTNKLTCFFPAFQ